MADGNKCLIVALLDRTGSMASVKTDTEGAFNAFIAQQLDLTAELNDEVVVTLAQFDSSTPGMVEDVYTMRRLADVPPLVLEPRAFTPLHDALGYTISRTDTQLTNLPEDERPGRVVFIVMTDGRDNYSREYTAPQVRQMVTARQSPILAGQTPWEFIFLGVGIDAFTVGGSYGIATHNTISVPHSDEGVAMAYAGTQRIVSSVRGAK